MGDNSEAFCRQAVDVMGENPGVLPVNFDLPEVRGDLAMRALRPRLIRTVASSTERVVAWRQNASELPSAPALRSP